MSRNKSEEWLDAPNANADKILRIADKMPTIAPSAQPEWKTLVLLYFISKKT